MWCTLPPEIKCEIFSHVYLQEPMTLLLIDQSTSKIFTDFLARRAIRVVFECNIAQNFADQLQVLFRPTPDKLSSKATTLVVGKYEQPSERFSTIIIFVDELPQLRLLLEFQAFPQDSWRIEPPLKFQVKGDTPGQLPIRIRRALRCDIPSECVIFSDNHRECIPNYLDPIMTDIFWTFFVKKAFRNITIEVAWAKYVKENRVNRGIRKKHTLASPIRWFNSLMVKLADADDMENMQLMESTIRDCWTFLPEEEPLDPAPEFKRTRCLARGIEKLLEQAMDHAKDKEFGVMFSRFWEAEKAFDDMQEHWLDPQRQKNETRAKIMMQLENFQIRAIKKMKEEIHACIKTGDHHKINTLNDDISELLSNLPDQRRPSIRPVSEEQLRKCYRNSIAIKLREIQSNTQKRELEREISLLRSFLSSKVLLRSSWTRQWPPDLQIDPGLALRFITSRKRPLLWISEEISAAIDTRSLITLPPHRLTRDD